MNRSIRKCLVLGLCLSSFSAYADWNCSTVDAGNHFWSSPGMTMERATAVAMNFCSGYSGDPSTCQVNKCTEE